MPVSVFLNGEIWSRRGALLVGSPLPHAGQPAILAAKKQVTCDLPRKGAPLLRRHKAQ